MIVKLLKMVAVFLAVLVGLMAAGLLVLTIAEYRPSETEAVSSLLPVFTQGIKCVS